MAALLRALKLTGWVVTRQLISLTLTYLHRLAIDQRLSQLNDSAIVLRTLPVAS